MALTPDQPSGEEVLDRARALLRDEEPLGWAELSVTLLQKLRATAVPAQSLLVHGAHGERGSRIEVSTRVLLPALRLAVDTDACVAEAIDLAIDRDGPRDVGGRLVGVDISLVCAYRSDLSELGRRAHEGALGVVRDLLGDDPGFGDDDVRVSVVDVVQGDPRLA